MELLQMAPSQHYDMSGPTRRRISRACDQCNQLRTKCDGQNPCAHCLEFGLACEYARARKKRGKASKRELLAAATGATAVDTGTGAKSPSSRDADRGRNATVREWPSQDQPSPQESREENGRALGSAGHFGSSAQPEPEISGMVGMQGSQSVQPDAPVPMDTRVENGLQGTLNDSNRPMSVSDLRSLQMLQQSSSTNARSSSSMFPSQSFNYPDSAYSLMNTQEANPSSVNQFRFGNSAEQPSVSFLGLSPGPLPGLLPLPSPSPANFPSFGIPPAFPSSLRYPVLQPVLPHISSIIPQSLACDLLDGYFTSSSASHLSPQSPYVVG
ncbi:hypothetical protein LTS12_028612, partial [Elasticomyces elasticus]